MSRNPIYSDLDNVLIGPIADAAGFPIDLEVRPDAGWFLESISKYGELALLTAANREWADTALRRLGSSRKFIKNVYTQEDMFSVALQLEMIDNARGITEEDRRDLDAQIPAIFPPGVIFDDRKRGSWMYRLKAYATGIALIDPSMWIEVQPFDAGIPDQGGLRRAFQEFLVRNSRWGVKAAMGSARKIARAR
jgi:hypothetical protein